MWVAWALAWAGWGIWQDNTLAAAFAFCWACAEMQRVLERRSSAQKQDAVPK